MRKETVTRVAWSLADSFVALTVAAVVAGLGAGIAALARDQGLTLAISAGLATAGLVALGGTPIVLWTRKQRLTYVSYPSPGFHCRILKKQLVYRIDDQGALHFSRIVELEALIDNVDRYTDKFLWTGGDAGLPLAGDGVAEVRPTRGAGIWRLYDSILERTLKRGESTEITVSWAPLKNWASSSPFVSTSSEEHTEAVEFVVEIPSKFRRDVNVIIEEMRCIESIYPFSTTAGKFDQNGRFRYELKPKPYRHYRVRWAWKGEPAVETVASLLDQSESTQ